MLQNNHQEQYFQYYNIKYVYDIKVNVRQKFKKSFVYDYVDENNIIHKEKIKHIGKMLYI